MIRPTYTITELAREFDVTPRAIRFYEDMGLLEPGREGRNRVYSQRDRTRLKLTLHEDRCRRLLAHALKPGVARPAARLRKAAKPPLRQRAGTSGKKA